MGDLFCVEEEGDMRETTTGHPSPATLHFVLRPLAVLGAGADGRDGAFDI